MHRVMELAVRAFLFNEKEEILVVRHSSDQVRTLPGGHVEQWETVYTALKRECEEEFGIVVDIIGSDTHYSDRDIVSMPLPIDIHVVQYDHRIKWPIQKFEYVFFARTRDTIDPEHVDRQEIYDWRWMDTEAFYALHAGTETFKWIQDLLEQQEDLLDIL